MCVIAIVAKEGPRPSQTMMENMWKRNDHGAGIAWRETDKKGETWVHWKKGLDEKSMQELCKTVPTPYVAHWRIASSGGIKDEFCHPFPISKTTTLALSGKTKGHVLFHNGTWSNWDDVVRMSVAKAGIVVPDGKFSDTRAMALLMAIHGHNFMELLPQQRAVAFGPEGMNIYLGPGWTKVDDIWCSNDFFVPHKGYSSNARNHNHGGWSRMCEYYACTETTLDADHRCTRHPKASFPTNGYETASNRPAPAVAPASPLPFQRLITVELAEMLHRQIDRDGKRRLSKNKLKDIKQIYSRMALGGKKGDRAKAQLLAISSPLQTLLPSPR